MEDDFVVVANTKGKADIWRHFGLKKRKHDGTVAVCKTCNSTIKTSGCTTNMTTHLRRYHPQLLSSGSMQAKSTPKPPSTDQAAASTASGVTQPASQQRRQQTLWSQTHQLEQTVSADSVEPDTSAGADCVSRLSGARHISYTTSATGCEPCSRGNPVESVQVDQLLEDGRATKTPTCLLDTLLTDVYVTHVEPAKSAYQLAIEEVERFREEPDLKMKDNPLIWWKMNMSRFQLLGGLAQMYLTVPATSVSSERVFSTARDFVTAQRANLKLKQVDQLIFLKKRI